MNNACRPPLPPFDATSAALKVRRAEDGWNQQNPAAIALAYSHDSQWRNRHEFISGRAAIIAFLERKWATEHDYRLIKELWTYSDARIAVRFAYEWHDQEGRWWRSYGNDGFSASHRLTTSCVSHLNSICPSCTYNNRSSRFTC